MKITNKTDLFALAEIILGAVALLLRLGLFLLGTDEKGLLIPWHPLDILTWAVTAAAVLTAAPALRAPRGKGGASMLPALGSFAMAAGIGLSVFSGREIWTRMDLIRNVCGVLAVPALILAGLSRLKRKQPFFGFHGVVCLFLTIRTVSQYQAWCSSPQLQTYFFSVAASILLALFAYYLTAADVQMHNRKLQLFTGLTGLFFCLAAAADLEHIPLYLGGALWMLTGLLPASEDADHETA